jgi:putative radical SAM enzyme (TIGR03279 family)
MTYPTSVQPAGPGGRIASIEPDSPAAAAGLQPGDVIVAADGAPVRDILDWMWRADGESVLVTARDAAGGVRDVEIQRDWDEPWGLSFEGVVFDGIRECDNACAFCFVSQLPPGLRPSLYVRDDDYRLSFLAGNFVTLTNLDDEDVARVLEMRLSPLHVSLHAVDPDVRQALMCPTVEDRALEHVDALLAGGIELHVQIVLVPGVNDGQVLERTLAWLAERRGVVSVGVVPLGYTRYQKRYAASYADGGAATAVLAALEPWRARMHAETGVFWVHAADELYLAAGEPFPSCEGYDGFPQFENGIGMVRAFLDELEALAEDLEPPATNGVPATLVTGGLFASVLRDLAPAMSIFGTRARVLAVPNAMLGGNVNVAGLLSGADIASAIATDAAPGPYLVPAVAVNDDGLFLDDKTVADLARLTHRDVRLVSSDAAGLAQALTAVAAESSG